MFSLFLSTIKRRIFQPVEQSFYLLNVPEFRAILGSTSNRRCYSGKFYHLPLEHIANTKFICNWFESNINHSSHAYSQEAFLESASTTIFNSTKYLCSLLYACMSFEPYQWFATQVEWPQNISSDLLQRHKNPLRVKMNCEPRGIRNSSVTSSVTPQNFKTWL